MRRARGQAAVETALTLPLFLFMILGTLQLFLLLQARLMTEHAAFVATRVGSLSSGKCRRMKQAALLTLLPTFTHTNKGPDLVKAFEDRRGNRFVPALDFKHEGDIVWLLRDVPGAKGLEDDGFDDPDRAQLNLETQVIFWYPMRIPFANWVIARSVVAAWGGARYDAVNPLAPSHDAHWSNVGRPFAVKDKVFQELVDRTGPNGTYVFPIRATSVMRMLTSPRQDGEFIFDEVCK